MLTLAFVKSYLVQLNSYKMRGQTTKSDFWFEFYTLFSQKWVFEGKNADVSKVNDVTSTFLVKT